MNLCVIALLRPPSLSLLFCLVFSYISSSGDLFFAIEQQQLSGIVQKDGRIGH